MRFNGMKTETLNLRVSPAFKFALRAAAHHEHRSMVNMLEVLVADFCDSKGVVITDRPRVVVPDMGSVSHSKQRGKQS